MSYRIPTVMRLYSIHNYRRYFIEEERRLKGGVACALGVASPPNKFDNGGRRVTPYSPYSLETVYMHTFIPVVYGKFPWSHVAKSCPSFRKHQVTKYPSQ